MAHLPPGFPREPPLPAPHCRSPEPSDQRKWPLIVMLFFTPSRSCEPFNPRGSEARFDPQLWLHHSLSPVTLPPSLWENDQSPPPVTFPLLHPSLFSRHGWYSYLPHRYRFPFPFCKRPQVRLSADPSLTFLLSRMSPPP